MKFWVGLLDNRGFEFLAEHKPDEVNFWQPSGTRVFSAIEPGEPFLFKLHSPQNYIVGGGLFVRHTFLPLSIAWETFRQKNGAPDFTSFAWQIRKYRESKGGYESDPVIGCIVLASPFFFTRDQWIPIPGDWSPNLVQGKRYSTDETTGLALWSAVQDRLSSQPGKPVPGEQMPFVFQEATRYGTQQLSSPNLGDGAFRVIVTDIYQRRCAATGEQTLPVLQATHIKPLERSGPNTVNNGILLRADLRLLFDNGFMTITGDGRIELSRRLSSGNGDGSTYSALHGAELQILPSKESDMPGIEYITWHNDNVFVP
jgi:putative restriction endonuclease